MILKTLGNVGVVALLGGMAVAAQAATLKFSSTPSLFWTFGNGNSVSVDSPVYNGKGGSFNGTVSGAQAGLNGLFAMYCVDLRQPISPGGNYSDFSVVSSTSYFGASKALQLAQLMTHGNAQVNLNDDKDYASTALQLAIWNTIHDTDKDLDVGLFKNTSTPGSSAANPSVNLLAESYLTGAVVPNSLQLFVLVSPTKQDQLVWLEGGVAARANIPEPTSLALAVGAFGMLGAVNRRRVSKLA